MPTPDPVAANRQESPLDRAATDPVSALALLVEACERGETNLRPYLDAGHAAVEYARSERPGEPWIERAWRETAEERKERLDRLTLVVHATVKALDLFPDAQAVAERGDPEPILDRIEEIVSLSLRFAFAPRPVLDAVEEWLEEHTPTGVETDSETVDRNVRWAVVRQWFEAAGGGS